MIRGRWIWDERRGELVPADEYQRQPVQRSSLPMPMVAFDTIEGGVESMVDGKIYTSKSALRRSYKAAGVVEVGNDPQRFAKKERPKINRKKVKESLEKAAARVNRGDVSDHLKHKV